MILNWQQRYEKDIEALRVDHLDTITRLNLDHTDAMTKLKDDSTEAMTKLKEVTTFDLHSRSCLTGSCQQLTGAYNLV